MGADADHPALVEHHNLLGVDKGGGALPQTDKVQTEETNVVIAARPLSNVMSAERMVEPTECRAVESRTTRKRL